MPPAASTTTTTIHPAMQGVTSGLVKATFCWQIVLLPTIIGGLLAEGKVDVKVLKSNDKWFGVTYKEDKESVVQEVRALVDAGMYPEK